MIAIRQRAAATTLALLDDLLGAGALAARGLGIVSMRFGGFSPHVNGGYVFRDDTLSNNGVLATLGFDHLLGSWATLAVDWISEWQLGEGKVGIPAPLLYDAPYRRSVSVTSIPDKKDNSMSLSVGFKFTTGRGMTFVANGLFPLADAGVHTKTRSIGMRAWSPTS